MYTGSRCPLFSAVGTASFLSDRLAKGCKDRADCHGGSVTGLNPVRPVTTNPPPCTCAWLRPTMLVRTKAREYVVASLTGVSGPATHASWECVARRPTDCGGVW